MASAGPPVVDATSVVDDGAIIGPGTRVWLFSHVRRGAVIGAHCMIADYCYIDTGASIGDYCRIQNHVSVYSGVTLDDHVLVGPGVRFTNDTFRLQWRHGEPAAPCDLGWTAVGAYTRIGAGAVILAGVKIGSDCTIGAGAIVLADVPDGSTVVGTWKRRSGWLPRLMRRWLE